jgi:hypothetical protein
MESRLLLVDIVSITFMYFIEAPPSIIKNLKAAKKQPNKQGSDSDEFVPSDESKN